MLIWTARSIEKRDPYKYPAGYFIAISNRIKQILINLQDELVFSLFLSLCFR